MKKHMMTGMLIIALCICMCQSATGKAAPLKLCKKNITLTKGCKYTLRIKGAKGGKSVKWSSCNKKIACVNKNGVITAKKKGCTTVTAKVKNKKLCCKITVKAKKLTQEVSPFMTQRPESGVKDNCELIPDITYAPETTTPAPAADKTPAATQVPENKAPSFSENFPSLQIPGLNLWIPNISRTPAATKAPETTPAPSATRTPTAVQTPAPGSSPSDSSSSVTEDEAYRILNSLRSTYPEGMPLTNSYYYYSRCFGNGYGCYGFAAKLSDTVFGINTPCSTHTSFDNIKVGDNIRIGNRHSVIVLTKSSNSITVVEGNYNSSVHWDRTITKSSLAGEGFKVTTRY